jgi:hypothetical protein
VRLWSSFFFSCGQLSVRSTGCRSCEPFVTSAVGVLGGVRSSARAVRACSGGVIEYLQNDWEVNTVSSGLPPLQRESAFMGRRSCLTMVPRPAHEHPPRIQMSYAVSHPADARQNRALGGAQQLIISEKSEKRFGISERRGPTPHLRPLQPSVPHSR